MPMMYPPRAVLCHYDCHGYMMMPMPPINVRNAPRMMWCLDDYWMPWYMVLFPCPRIMMAYMCEYDNMNALNYDGPVHNAHTPYELWGDGWIIMVWMMPIAPFLMILSSWVLLLLACPSRPALLAAPPRIGWIYVCHHAWCECWLGLYAICPPCICHAHAPVDDRYAYSYAPPYIYEPCPHMYDIWCVCMMYALPRWITVPYLPPMEFLINCMDMNLYAPIYVECGPDPRPNA